MTEKNNIKVAMLKTDVDNMCRHIDVLNSEMGQVRDSFNKHCVENEARLSTLEESVKMNTYVTCAVFVEGLAIIGGLMLKVI